MSESWEEQGRVERIEGRRAIVRVIPSGFCQHCRSAGFCNWSGKRERVVVAVNPVGAKLGDEVIIARKVKPGVWSALTLFGLPAVLMLFGGLIGGLLLGDVWAVVLAGIGLALAVVIVKLIDKKKGGTGADLPVISEVILGHKGEGDKNEEKSTGVAGESNNPLLS